MKDVGIVMPVYKQDPVYLELALQSILEQSYQSYHFVIVSDGAPSEINDIIKKVMDGDKRVHFILKEKNEGVSKALNTGFDFLMNIKEVKYLTWVSSDNIYFSNFVEMLRAALADGPEELGLVYSSFRHIDENGNHILNKDLLAFRKFQEKPKEKLLDYCYVGTSFMYKKHYASMISGYFMEPVEDYEYWLRLTEYCEMKYVPTELMDYRVSSPHSISAQLQSSTAQHRRWRYAFNLAKQQARNRREIPFETTVIFPIQQFSEKVVTQYENLLEQSYSNYKFLILDLSPHAAVSNVLKHISDPRVAFLELANASLGEALMFGIEAADTPFTLLYGHGYFPKALDSFSILIDVHDKLAQRPEYTHIVSTFFLSGLAPLTNQEIFQSNAGPASFRIFSSQLEPRFGELYRTEKLKKLIIKKDNLA
jgi:glycosyltransferase involved in cell wall biosynthesis